MPYSSLDADALTFRDHLALDRTVLANERTLLAYQRTALALLITGGSLVKLFPEDRGMSWLGWGVLAFGLLLAVLGGLRFLEERRRTWRLRATAGSGGAEAGEGRGG